ncbi:MAG TPA: protein kinase [Acidobacteriota bacterium]|nr:protein kinase [Acidobacteriota bacterium]
MNPYLNRLMIQAPEQFFGRRKEVARILARVGAPRPQSVSLVGERRIGKSSLLFHLTWNEVRKRYLEDQDGLIVVFFDLQQLHNLPPDEFLLLLVGRIRQAVRETGRAVAAGTAQGGFLEFQNLLEEMNRKEVRLVLLFDEFDAITSNPRFQKEFYAFLRSMANNYAVSYVTSSRMEIQSLCHSAEIADSPFFNIFSNLYLRPFEQSEALELISVPSEKAGRPLKEYAAEIISMAGLQPFFLQIACCACFEYLTEMHDTPFDRGAVEARFLEEAAPHFDYLIDHFTEEQLRVLRTIANGNQPYIEDLADTRRLVRDGHLTEHSKGQFMISSRLFAAHLRENAGKKNSVTTGQSVSGRRFLKAGDRLEQYEILGKADEGGMGCVYQAHDIILGRKVAIKIIRPELLGTVSMRQRFFQEARLAAALNHPAITSVYEFLDLSGQVVLVMEWLEGRSLKQIIREEGRIHWKQLAHLISQAASGLEAAHSQGIIHRDVKSANLFVLPGEQIKILDFGLAKHITPLTVTEFTRELSSVGMVVGTIDYMSPEQACAERVDHRTDLFSLGVVFYEGLTGALPFRRGSAAASVDAILNHPPPDLALYEVEGAERVEPIINRLLEKSPARRYQSARQLEKDLQDLLKPRKFRWW